MTTSTTPRRKLLSLRRDREGFWLYVEAITGGEPWWGPYATKADALEARRSWLRNNISAQRPCDIKSEWKGRRKAVAS
jgi:hypothetical protein